MCCWSFGAGNGCGAGCGCPIRAPPGMSSEPVNRMSEHAGVPQPNGCHCPHVDKLMEEMAAVKIEMSHLRSSFGARPFTPPATKKEPATGSTDARGGDFEAPRHDGPRSQSLPLKLGPLGALGDNGRPPFDYRIVGQPEFQFSSKGGDQWKGKTERYFTSVVPAVYPLFEWAGRQF